MKNISGDSLQRIARELIDFNKLSAQLAAKEIRERHRRAGIVFFPISNVGIFMAHTSTIIW